jgi:peptidyl-prolyl cis-trans isomerase A (cyclophilin A)
MRRLLAALLLLAPLGARAENPVVRFTTPYGVFEAELCAETSAHCGAAAPASVANFLGYVDRGDYVGSVVHRSTTLGSAGVVVIQGGGFRRIAADAVRPIPTQPPIPNEFDPANSNVRGTLAWARLGGQPDSATSQWFVNVVDGNAVLDGVDGGFTVFGVVTGDGMQVVDAISGLTRVNLDSTYLDPLFGPQAVTIAASFQETPLPDDFVAILGQATSEEDLPPIEDFAAAMVGTEITRVPEAAGSGLAAAGALALLALRRAATR